MIKFNRRDRARLDDFLAATLARQLEAEQALINGDPEPRLALTSTQDPLIAGASGDLAYVVGFEHIANSVNDVPVEPYTLRVTHIFRRENGEWKIAHRHADYVPIDQPSGQRSLSRGGPATPRRALIGGRDC